MLDVKLAAIVQRRNTPPVLGPQMCRLYRKKPSSTAYWQRWIQLHSQLHGRFGAIAADGSFESPEGPGRE